ncbi:exported protein of unknown function [Bradyrhizobium sp. ORS 285]|uniref:hypothetical protein n=1 Tax=Bradyrhizobium sp. ORS 285 TaxID=115808 RepID=UPI000240958D|nr:hypothetical protein [Bradyrhizobium sp. ORS 285]CCD89841.1 exported hypothetical protein [Bradyrhizobium sp. ORS 285]SMX61529.1 exported protein of unknown function [Bradyrhizobium sp. ORS 285]
MSKALATKNIAAVLLGIGMILSVFGFATPAHANPSLFAIATSTAAATTTVTSMGAGLATTTLYFDSYAQTFFGGNKQRPDFGLLLVQKTGSSTSAVLNIAFEYADDISGTNCTVTPAACDWYQNYTGVNYGATTTAYVGPAASIAWRAATTTIGGATSSSPRETGAFLVQTYTRYVRAVFTATGATSTVWARFIPIQQYK